jgi:hypothetical protein
MANTVCGSNRSLYLFYVCFFVVFDARLVFRMYVVSLANHFTIYETFYGLQCHS